VKEAMEQGQHRHSAAHGHASCCLIPNKAIEEERSLHGNWWRLSQLLQGATRAIWALSDIINNCMLLKHGTEPCVIGTT
jgi:hypothetical protein